MDIFVKQHYTIHKPDKQYTFNCYPVVCECTLFKVKICKFGAFGEYTLNKHLLYFEHRFVFSFCLFPSISCAHGTMKGDYYLITYYSSNAAAKCTGYFRVSTEILLKGCCHFAID